MKNRSLRAAGILATLTFAMTLSAARAADFFWDGGIFDLPEAGDGASAGGAGEWATTLANWDIGAVPHVVWPEAGTDNDAVFGGAAGAVSLVTPITANDITFATTGYTVGGSGPLTLNGETSILTVGADGEAVISTPIGGEATTSLSKAGPGRLTLSSANSFTGATTISAGTLRIGNILALGTRLDAADGTTIASGATLDLGGIANGTGLERVTASGSGVAGSGAILSSAPIPTPFIGVRHLTLTGETTLGYTNRWDVGSNTLLDNTFVGGGFTLNLTGSGTGQASFNNLGETDLGDINVNLGDAASAIFYLQGNTTLGRPAHTVNITGGSTLHVFTSSTVPIFDKKFSLDNGKITVQRPFGAELAGTIALASANTVTALTPITTSGAISGSGSLTKAGVSSLALAGPNNYTGGTVVTAGTLVFRNTAAVPATGQTLVETAGALALGVGGDGFFSAADVDSLLAGTMTNVVLAPASGFGIDTTAGDFTYPGTSSAARPFTKLGENTLTFSGINPYTGSTTVAAGTLLLAGGADSLSTTAAITVAASATLDLGGTTQTTTGLVSLGSGSTLRNGTLTANNTGAFNNVNGTFNTGDAGAIVTNQRLLVGNSVVRAVILNSAATGSFTFGGNAGAAQNYVGVGTGNGTLTVNGGTVNFTNVPGGNGYLQIGANNNAARGSVIVNEANVNVGTLVKLGGNYLTGVSTNAIASLTIAGGTFRIGGGTDAGTAATTGLNGVLYLHGHAGNNTTSTGTATVTLNSGGILSLRQIQAGNGSTKNLHFDGGTLQARAAAPLFLENAPALNVTVRSGGATIDTQAFDVTVNAPITEGNTPGGGLAKLGSGKLTLPAANAYTGPTAVSAGTLALGSASLADGAALTIAAGATLQLDHGGIDTVASLTLGATTFTSGDFDLTTPGGFITGSGVIRVIAPIVGSYATWATANGIPGEPAGEDFDQDGLPNLVEYALGRDPKVSTLPPGTFTGGVLSFTKGSDALANGDLSYQIERSADLGDWTVVVENDPESLTISHTLPPGETKTFARLKVTRIP